MTPEELVGEVDHLFSLPDAVMRINELLESDSSTITDFGEVIGHDPALSARLLKLVNSAFYGFPSQVDTITRAITLIGTQEVRNIVMAASAVSVFDEISSDLIDMTSFWHRSVFCGLVAKKVAATTRRTRGESQFLSGLMHDLGKLVLILKAPQAYGELMRVSSAEGTPLADLENEWLGFSSADIGAELLRAWRLPESLWVPVKYQYHPEACDTYINETHILNLAMRVTNCVEPELKSGLREGQLDGLDTIAMSEFGIAPEDLGLIVENVNIEALEVLAIINPGSTSSY